MSAPTAQTAQTGPAPASPDAPAGAGAAARPSALRVWLGAARPQTLAAGAVPVGVGTALAAADGRLAWGPALGALLGALLIQVGTNLHNDAADFRRGADGPDRLGPPRACARGWLTPRQVQGAAWAAFAGAAAVGVGLILAGGWPIAALGVLSILSGLAYTGGPFPLAYHGLGEAFVLAFFGVGAVLGTDWVQGRALAPGALPAALAVGSLAAAILAVNNLRDREQDARAGKRTLAVRLPERAARAEYALLVAAPYLLVAGAAWILAGWGWLLPWLSAPLAAREVLALGRAEGAALNPLLGRTARLELLFGLLLALGVLL